MVITWTLEFGISIKDQGCCNMIFRMNILLDTINGDDLDTGQLDKQPGDGRMKWSGETMCMLNK